MNFSRSRIVGIEISEIRDTRPRSVQVLVASTGKLAWVPRAQAQFFPGRVFVPDWLAERILQPTAHE